MTKRTPRKHTPKTKAATPTRKTQAKKRDKTPGKSRQPRPHSKQATMMALLTRPQGARLDHLVAATGWQRHSVRAALALMKPHFGVAVKSEKIDGVRTYRLAASEATS